VSSVPAGEDPYQVAIACAADMVGGAAELSRRSQIPLHDLMQWIRGTRKASTGNFLRVVDVVIEESRKARLRPG
jgi:hypothetical protein